MEENNAHKCYLCKFCNQSFTDGMKFRVHIRRHMELFSGRVKQSTIEHDQETINGELGELGLVSDEIINNRSEESLGLDENFCRPRENPKKSWKVSVCNLNSICKQCGKGFDSMTDLETHMRFHSPKSKESFKKNLCAKCGKGFDSLRALYGHMRLHKIKKSQPFKKSTSISFSVSSSSSEDGLLDERVKGEFYSPIRRKRSCTMYNKPANPNDPSSSTSLSPFVTTDEETEEVALCLMMLARGLDYSGGGKMVISPNQEVGVSVDGSMFKKEVIGKCGSSHANMDIVYNDLRSNGQNVRDKGKRKVYDDQCDTNLGKSKDYKCTVDGSIMRFRKVDFGESWSGHNAMHIVSNELKKYGQIVRDNGNRKVCDDQCDTTSKSYKCSICFKEFVSGQALGGHMRAHYNVVTSNETDSKEETVDAFNIHEHMERMDLEGGIKNDMAQQ